MFSALHIARASLVALALAATQAHASLVTVVGATFDIRYDASLLNASLFGTPTLTGNTLSFTPASFSAQSINGNQYATQDSTINLELLPHTGQQITAVALTERGDYLLRGNQSFVEVTGQIRLFDLDHPLNEDTNTITATTAMTVADGVVHNWQAGAQIQVLGNGALPGATRFNLTLENLLGAYTSNTDNSGPLRAFIQKKNAIDGVSMVISTVPEPGAWGLALAGLLVVPFVARRHRDAL
jgi:hypothetical protein